ncbi:hypothetical protein MCERE19_01172 [Spirosomataceae bacterium]
MYLEMKNLKDKFNQLINDNLGNIEEPGYPSRDAEMWTHRPNIKTIAILETANLHDEQAYKEYNSEPGYSLSSNFHFYKRIHAGSNASEGKENSFIIFNISLDDAINKGVCSKRDSIIYGETGNVAENGEIAMTFKMIGLDKTKPDEYEKEIGKINVFINRDNAENFCGRIGNRKFVIPFYGVIDKLVDKDSKIFDLYRYYKDCKWEAGTERATNYSEYEINEQFGKLENLLNDLTERLMREGLHSRYISGNRLRELIIKR